MITIWVDNPRGPGIENKFFKLILVKNVGWVIILVLSY